MDHTIVLYNVTFKKSLKCVYNADELNLDKPYLYVDHRDKQPEETFVIIDLNTLIWKAYFPTAERKTPFINCCGQFVYIGNTIVPKWSNRQNKILKVINAIGLIGVGIFSMKKIRLI